MKAIGIIPARIASTRLPGKLLLSETGKPLLQYAWEAASKARSLSQVIIAGDSAEIGDVVRGFGGAFELTGDHPSGTDRVAEVVRRRNFPAESLIVNLQGDEPELEPEHIDRLVEVLATRPTCGMATLVSPIRTLEVLNDPGCVKAVVSAAGEALYFSRAAIPFCRDGNVPERLAAASPWRLHIGIYAYRTEWLLRLAELPVSPLEELEKLEQLRALEAGCRIATATVDGAAPGIDTPADYAAFVKRQAGR